MKYAEINGALAILENLPTFKSMENAIKSAPKKTPKDFLDRLEKSFRKNDKGWSLGEYEFTAIQPDRRGRPRAMDFCNETDSVGVEVELSNQSNISHDFLKLETAFNNRYIHCGVLVVPLADTREKYSWPNQNWYTKFEGAEVWLNIYAPSLRSPIVVWGF